MKVVIKNFLREKERGQVAKALLFMLVLFIVIGSDSSGADTKNAITSNTTFKSKGITYGAVTSPLTGRVWLDRNLGASRVCTALNDKACYGDYYQWGRETDGHEKSTSATTKTVATDIINVGNKFIFGDTEWTSKITFDSSIDRDGDLRAANWSKTDGSSVCPVGYRVPTMAELEAEATVFKNNTGAFKNFLKLPSAGYRAPFEGTMSGNRGMTGYVWSSTARGPANNLVFYGRNTYVVYEWRTCGYSVRCIKD